MPSTSSKIPACVPECNILITPRVAPCTHLHTYGYMVTDSIVKYGHSNKNDEHRLIRSVKPRFHSLSLCHYVLHIKVIRYCARANPPKILGWYKFSTLYRCAAADMCGEWRARARDTPLSHTQQACVAAAALMRLVGVVCRWRGTLLYICCSRVLAVTIHTLTSYNVHASIWCVCVWYMERVCAARAPGLSRIDCIVCMCVYCSWIRYFRAYRSHFHDI